MHGGGGFLVCMAGLQVTNAWASVTADLSFHELVVQWVQQGDLDDQVWILAKSWRQLGRYPAWVCHSMEQGFSWFGWSFLNETLCDWFALMHGGGGFLVHMAGLQVTIAWTSFVIVWYVCSCQNQCVAGLPSCIWMLGMVYGKAEVYIIWALHVQSVGLGLKQNQAEKQL